MGERAPKEASAHLAHPAGVSLSLRDVVDARACRWRTAAPHPLCTQEGVVVADGELQLGRRREGGGLGALAFVEVPIAF